MLWRLPATQLAGLIRSRKVSAREAVQAALDRLDDVNGRINAVVDCSPVEALTAADVIDARLKGGEEVGPLAGAPVTVKVNVDQAGHATTEGVALQRDLVAQTNNPVVDNLLKAGAVIIGRTNVPAFCLRWFTANRLYGETRNPRDPRLTPGARRAGPPPRRRPVSLPERTIGGQIGAASGPLARSIADIRLALAVMAARRDLRRPRWARHQTGSRAGSA
jgi:amidase